MALCIPNAWPVTEWPSDDRTSKGKNHLGKRANPFWLAFLTGSVFDHLTGFTAVRKKTPQIINVYTKSQCMEFTCSVIKCFSWIYFQQITNSLLRVVIYSLDFKTCFKTMATIAYLAK